MALTGTCDGVPYSLTPEEEQAELAAVQDRKLILDAKKAREAFKRHAFTFNGVPVSVTQEDAIALMQVKMAFEMGEAATTVRLSNGNKLPLVPSDMPQFAPQFAAARNSLFQA